MKNLSQIKSELFALSIEAQYELSSYLSQCLISQKENLFAQRSATVDTCPHCNSTNIIKWGNFGNMKRFRCKDCKRTFTPTTGSALHWLKKPDKFIDYSLALCADGLKPLSKRSSEFGINIKTAFEWRHKLLAALNGPAPVFDGIVELDDIWFLYSQKGRKGLKYSRKRGGSKRKGDNDFQAKVLISKQRQGTCDMSLVKIGRISAADIDRRLKGKFAHGAILVSDKHPSISSFAKKQDLEHHSFIAKAHVKDKKWHVQSVNRLAGLLKENLNRYLKGVSTKYLQNYISWFANRNVEKNAKGVIEKCLNNINSWSIFMNIEKLYEQFIQNHSVRTYRCPVKRFRKSQYWNLDSAMAGTFL